MQVMLVHVSNIIFEFLIEKDEEKDMELRAMFGGLCNCAADPCYHQDCDSIENLSETALEMNGVL